MKSAAISLILFLGIATSAYANTVSPVSLVGPGTSSCGTWLNDRQVHSIQAALDEDYVLGVIQGMIVAAVTGPSASGLTIDTDYNGIFAWVDNYCRANPTTMFLYGASNFFYRSDSVHKQ